MTSDRKSIKVIATTLIGTAIAGTFTVLWAFVGDSLEARASRIVDVRIAAVKKESKLESAELKKDIIDRLNNIENTQKIILQRLMNQ